MQSLTWYFNRLRSMDAAEIAWRIKGVASANLDLLRIPLGLYPKLNVTGALSLDEFEPGARCISAGGEWAESAPEPFRSWRTKLLPYADTVMQNRLSFFDLEEVHLGDPPDWHYDFSAKKHSPRRLSVLVDYRDFDSAGDCKLVWEPNRHHQFVVLGRAWQVTRDQRYARKVVDLILHWIQENPFGYGMNWKSPLEHGVRLINWVCAIDLIRDASVFEVDEWETVLRTIYLAMWDAQRKFSRGSSANNHLIGEVAGVHVAACYFPQMPNADKWRRESQGILEHEIFAQSFTDGCTREHAFGYQFFVLQFHTVCRLLAERCGTPFSAEFDARLHQMYRFMADICADTGRPPNFGDADDGYVLDLGNRPVDSASLLTVGGHLFDDPDLILTQDSETSYWLFGESTLSRERGNRVAGSKAYRESGYFVLRTTTSRECWPVRIFFDCAELGFGSIAAHGHADCLSFSLAVNGQEMLVDPGTFDYFTYPEWRRYYRSTPAHNTVTVDGENQSELQGSFIWGQRANARLLEWVDEEATVQVSGEHDGYRRLPEPVTHRRSVSLRKGTGIIDVCDRIETSGKHRLQLHFHVAADCAVDRREDGAIRVTRSPVRLEIRSNGGDFQVVQADANGHLGWISDGYHRRAPGHCLVLEKDIDGTTEIATQIGVFS